MNYAAVARAGGHAEFGILLNEENVVRTLGNSVRYGAADYAATDDENVGLVHFRKDLTTDRTESTERSKQLLADGRFVEIRLAINQLGFCAIVDGIGRAAALVVCIVPKRGGAMYSIFVQRIEKDVKGR